MEVSYTKSLKNFIEIAIPLLEPHEDRFSLIFGIILSLKKNPEAYKEVHHCVVSEDGEPVAIAIITIPHKLLIYCQPGYEEKALPAIAKYFNSLPCRIPGVLSEASLSERFAGLWSELTGDTLKIAMRQGIYRCDKAEPVPPAEGKMRIADGIDVVMLTHWVQQFQEYLHQPISEEEALKYAVAHVNNIRIWDNNGAVCMAATLRPTVNAICISLVYTPEEHRGKGYATALVQQLTKEMLTKKYRFCVLHTDMDNPISNSIYMKIGYNKRADYTEYDFIEIKR
ncbi:MAG: GNAT family N-acetyltransferase [Candidatus Cloacimonetes bacterium]|nr:GNAT family N-acetyltransferase [Candidatus Cloacimonadota bacterium]